MLQPPLVALEHGREAPADAAVVELHRRLGPELGEDLLPLRLGEPPQIQLVVVAQEDAPTAR